MLKTIIANGLASLEISKMDNTGRYNDANKYANYIFVYVYYWVLMKS